jgi:hypothetical protein
MKSKKTPVKLLATRGNTKGVANYSEIIDISPSSGDKNEYRLYARNIL